MKLTSFIASIFVAACFGFLIKGCQGVATHRDAIDFTKPVAEMEGVK